MNKFIKIDKKIELENISETHTHTHYRHFSSSNYIQRPTFFFHKINFK